MSDKLILSTPYGGVTPEWVDANDDVGADIEFNPVVPSGTIPTNLETIKSGDEYYGLVTKLELDTVSSEAANAVALASSAASDVSDLSATVSTISDDVNDLKSKTKILQYNLTEQEAAGIVSSSYSNKLRIGINQNLSGYDKVILNAKDFSIEFRYTGIYGPAVVFEARVGSCILYDSSDPAAQQVADLEFTLYSAGNRVFVASTLTITRYYGITISGISINQNSYTLHAIVDAYGVDYALEAAGTTMTGLQSNFQQLAQANPTLFAQLLCSLCNNGFEFARPCYLQRADVETLLCTAIDDASLAILFGSGAVQASISLDTSAIPTEFASASLLYSTRWLSDFGVLSD